MRTSGCYHNPNIPPFYGLQRDIIRSLDRVKVECRGLGVSGFRVEGSKGFKV